MQHPKNPSLLHTIILLTCLLILSQILFLWVNSLINNLLDNMLSASLTTQMLHSKIVIIAFIKFIGAQLVTYSVFIGFIWYVSVSIGELFSLSYKSSYALGLALWCISVIAVITANIYYVPYSFFSGMIRDNLFHHAQNPALLRNTLIITTSILLLASMLTFINLYYQMRQKKNLFRHGVALFFLLTLFIVFNSNRLFTSQANPVIATDQPNIIIIGIDALRPDYVGFYNNKKTHTPTLNTFLETATDFTNAYTTLARTFPSWSSILTGAYPLHNRARGNNTDLEILNLDETLPKRLQQAGYETIYSTDDTRFNNTNALFGFDQVVTPPMGLNDFLIGTLNDFPLTNLLIPTPAGKWLFPYNYANHGVAITYDPRNYLQVLSQTLHSRSQKPLFLAVHFTITHWPFYWFNDKQPVNQRERYRYQASVEAADRQISHFLTLLHQNHLLDHTIVVLLSDHGLALGLRGDRAISQPRYQGDPVNIKKLTVAKYSSAPPDSLDLQHDYGIDTSYGYGGDVLSLNAYHTLFAIKGYGIPIATPHQVSDRVSLIDIAPTLLDLVHLTPLQHGDGISLKPYLQQVNIHFASRPFYLETTFSIEEIEKEGISIAKVLQKTLQLYHMDPKSGLIFINPDAEHAMNQNKEVAILQGDWLLARFPETERTQFSKTAPSGLQNYVAPPFMVLLNLKTGAWTTELDTPLARTAPIALLHQQLYAFYGKELN